MYKRKMRLQEEREVFKTIEKKQRKNLDKFGLSKNAVLMGIYFLLNISVVFI